MDAVCRVRHSRCSPTGRGKAFTLTLATGCHGMGSWRGHREHEPGHRTATSRLTALPGPTLQGTCSVPWTSCSLSFQSTDLVQQGPSPRALPTPPYDLNSGVLTGSVLTSSRVISKRQPAIPGTVGRRLLFLYVRPVCVAYTWVPTKPRL